MADGYRVIAAFRQHERARRAVDRVVSAGVASGKVRLVEPPSPSERGAGPAADRDPDRVSELRAEMREEVAEGWSAAPVGYVTPEQAEGASKGVVTGLLIGTAVGIVVGFLWAIIGEAPFTPFVRALLGAIPFMAGGAVAGAVVGGASNTRFEGQRKPHRGLDDEKLAGERDTLVAVEVDDGATCRRVKEVLDDIGAERVDVVTPEGTPAQPMHDEQHRSTG